MLATPNLLLFLAGIAITVALPLEELKPDLNYLKARGAVFDASCDRVIPGSPEKKHYRVKAERAFEDAFLIASAAQFGKDSKGNVFTSSSAYNHYFGKGDMALVGSLTTAILDAHISTADTTPGSAYDINFKCGSDQSPHCTVSTIAATSPKPGDSTIILCDTFFKATTRSTKLDLYSKRFGTKRGQWCQPGEEFPFFEVAGLTILHEMTHLHVVGERAGLPARQDPEGFKSCGTVDVYVQGTKSDQDHYKDMEPWKASRELLRLWSVWNADHNAYKPTTHTLENAESYAAAALEFYFLNGCNWDTILP